MTKDTLFLLEKDFTDVGNGPFYCPESAFVEGILSYYLQLREQFETRYVGSADQGCPVLVSVTGPTSTV